VRAAQNGSLEAFNRLVLAHQELAYNLAYRMLSDPAAADDATQNAFFSAFRGMPSFRGGSFRAWVLRMVVNACYDEFRRQKRRPTVPLEPVYAEEEEEVESAPWMVDGGPTPEEALDQAELQHAVQHCLNQLPADFRAVVVMVDLEGLDYSEASQAASKPVGTIKSRLARARLRMRDCLRSVVELLPAQLRLEREGTR